jgi:hypothetical protein
VREPRGVLGRWWLSVSLELPQDELAVPDDCDRSPLDSRARQQVFDWTTNRSLGHGFPMARSRHDGRPLDWPGSMDAWLLALRRTRCLTPSLPYGCRFPPSTVLRDSRKQQATEISKNGSDGRSTRIQSSAERLHPSRGAASPLSHILPAASGLTSSAFEACASLDGSVTWVNVAAHTAPTRQRVTATPSTYFGGV